MAQEKEREPEPEPETCDVSKKKGGDPDKSKDLGDDEPDEGAQEGRGGDPDKSKRI